MSFLQGLEPIFLGEVMSDLKVRPPKAESEDRREKRNLPPASLRQVGENREWGPSEKSDPRFARLWRTGKKLQRLGGPRNFY